MKGKFIKALESNDLDEMRKIPKGDLNNHSSIGGNKSYIEEWVGKSIRKCPKFNDLNNMHQWFRQNIKTLAKGTLGYMNYIYIISFSLLVQPISIFISESFFIVINLPHVLQDCNNLQILFTAFYEE